LRLTWAAHKFARRYVIQPVADCVRQIVDNWSRVNGIGYGSPGPLDSKRGVILEARNLPGMTNFPMKARLEKEFHVPAFIQHDAKVAALAEHRFGAGRGFKHMIYMTISTGIGGGIIANGKIYLGWRGFAGEYAWDFLSPGMIAEFEKRTMSSTRKGVQIVLAQLGDNVGLLGAAVLVIDGLSSNA
jgi:glucokinase